MLITPPSTPFIILEAVAQEKETVCSAFDRLCDEEPEHYVKRYITEPNYQAWFDRNFPDYTIYEGIGITLLEYKEIQNDLLKEKKSQEKKYTEKLGEEKPKHDIDSLLDDLKRDAGKTKIDDN